MSEYHTRAQVGFELLITIGLIIITLLVFLGLNEKYLTDYDESYKYRILQASLDDLSFAINSVYQQGTGAGGKEIIELPEGITSNTVSGKSIVYYLKTKGKVNSFEKTFEFDVNGSLPLSPGKYEIIITSKERLINLETS